MTQKELLYMQDAIGHQINMVKILENMVICIDDKKVVTFLNKEIKKLNLIKDSLMKKLEDKVNE